MLPAVLGFRYSSSMSQSIQVISLNSHIYKSRLHPMDYFSLCIISYGIYRRAKVTMKIIVQNTQILQRERESIFCLLLGYLQ